MAVGIGDLVSTVIRQTLIQMQTPDEMRGRVFSVNSLFYGTSSQIGQFRAGITAEWFGAVAAVAIGGAALLGAVAVWAWLFPALAPGGKPGAGRPGRPDGRSKEGWAAAVADVGTIRSVYWRPLCKRWASSPADAFYARGGKDDLAIEGILGRDGGKRLKHAVRSTADFVYEHVRRPDRCADVGQSLRPA